MPLVIHVRRRNIAAVVLLALAPLLASCTMTPASKTYTKFLTGSANPIQVQNGRLTVVALELADGGPLMRATVEIVASDGNVKDPHYYRRTGVSDKFGSVTFRDVPRLVNVAIWHERGTYSVDNYPVPQTGTSEFRVYVETTGARPREECLAYGTCGLP